MPQTVSNAFPNGHGILVAGDVFATRPEAALWIARLVSLWSSNEHLLGGVFCEALGEAKHPAAAMYQSLSSSSVQIETAAAAIDTQLPSEEVKLKFAGVVANMKRAKRVRDKLAHWVYAETEDAPKAILLIAPRLVIEHFHIRRDKEVVDLRKHAYVYDSTELSRIHDQFKVVEASLQVFLSYLRSQGPDDRVLNPLSRMPDIQEAIRRIVAGKKPHQARLGQPGEGHPR